MTSPGDTITRLTAELEAVRAELESALRQRDELLQVIETMRSGLVDDIRTAVRVHVQDRVEVIRRGPDPAPNR